MEFSPSLESAVIPIVPIVLSGLPNRVRVTTKKGDTFFVDVVVIARPLGVLQPGTIEFEPKLS